MGGVMTTWSDALRRRHRGSPAGRGLDRLDRSARLSDPSKSSARMYGTHRLFSGAHRLSDGRQTVTAWHERRRRRPPEPERGRPDMADQRDKGQAHRVLIPAPAVVGRAVAERFYLPQLDGLRFFAFLTVFLDHG